MAIEGLGYTEGSGKSVAADAVGGKDYQLIKLAQGLEGTATLVSSTDPLPVTLLASGAVIGHVIVDSGSITVANASLAVTGTFWQATQPVSGTVAATQSGTWTVTGAGGTFPVTGTFWQATQPVSGTVAIGAGSAVIGHVITDTGSTTAVTGNVTAVQATGTNLHMVVDSGTITTVSTVTAVTAITNALPAGSNAIGKLAANSGVIIGDVNVVSEIPGTGATALGKAEDAAHSSGDTGVMALAVRSDTAASTAGTTGDYQPPITDKDGALWVNQSNVVVSGRIADTAGSAAAVTNFGATGSISNYVTAITVFRTDAGTSMAYVDFTDGNGGTVLWTMPLPPAGGSVIASPKALFKTTQNTALYYDVSAALTTVYISVSGIRQA